MTRQRNIVQRGLATSAVFLLVLAQLGAMVHHAAVRHVRCEHGELVEAPSLSSHTPGEVQFVAVESDHDGVGDDHCVVANGLRPHALSSLAAWSVDPVPAATDPLADPAERPRLIAELYLTAPKTSPPA